MRNPHVNPLFGAILNSHAEALAIAHGEAPCEHKTAKWSRASSEYECHDCGSVLPINHPAVDAFEDLEASKGLAEALRRCELCERVSATMICGDCMGILRTFGRSQEKTS